MIAHYPHLPSWSRVGGIPCYVFDKLDGSNVAAVVNRKGDYLKFFKREGLLDDTVPHLNEARTLIPEKYGDAPGRMVKDYRHDTMVFYFEFHGPKSFAGWHAAEPHTVTLFDIAVSRKSGTAILEPNEYLRACRKYEFDHAALLHQGNFTSDVAEAVSNGTLEGMTLEGVVAKGSWDEKQGRPMMFKWKNLAWLKLLKAHCGDDEKLFEKLA